MTLQDLVESIMTSVAKAQDEIEKQNLQHFSNYFDSEGKPQMVTVRLPKHEASAHESEQEELKVPVLSLMQLNPVKIKEMTVDFQISLNAVEKIEQASDAESIDAKSENNLLDTTDHELVKQKRQKRVLSTDLFSKGFGSKSKNRNAEVKITFESGEPPEGVMKLNSHLLRLF